MTVTAQRLAVLAELDAKLEKRADSTTLALMEHRHNAVAEVGTIRAYAKAIHRTDVTVRKYVRAWEMFTEDRPDTARARSRTPSDLLHLASLSEDRRLAVEAVADAKGLGARTIERGSTAHRPEVTRVQNAIRELPPEHKADRATTLAQQIERTRTNQRERAEQKKQTTSRAWRAIEAELAKANRHARAALDYAIGANLDDETRELIADSADKLLATINLLKLSATDAAPGTDWDAELERITAK